MNYSNIKSEGLQGIDVSKEITLKEYGFGYHVLPKKDIYRFYIGNVDFMVEKEIGDFNFTEWKVLELPLNVKIEEEAKENENMHSSKFIQLKSMINPEQSNIMTARSVSTEFSRLQVIQ